jgi:hypothetical protein
MKAQVFRISGYVLLVAALSLPLCLSAQKAATTSATPAVTTPRTANGKVDFSGYWGPLSLDAQKLASTKDNIVGGLEGGNGSPEAFSWWITHFERDAQVGMRAQRNRPLYKPEYWDKIRATDWNFSRKNDPAQMCKPSVPRLGVPQKIVQTSNEIIFLYEDINRFRIIPTDNRPHHPVRSETPSWFGDSVGHWEGDDLVIETTALTDESWLGITGYIHSDTTRALERFHRDGNTITLQKTVEDPMLMQPWQMDPITAKLNTGKTPAFQELLCVDKDSGLLSDPNNLDPTRQGH